MTRFRLIATLVALVGLTTPALADWATGVKVSKLYTYADGAVKVYVTGGNIGSACLEPTAMMLAAT